MDEKTLSHFRELFLVMRSKHMQSNYDLENDFIWRNEESALKVKLAKNRDHYLKRLDMALERIEDGTFGHCVECFEEIEKVQIFMRPTQTHCNDCSGSAVELYNKIVPLKRNQDNAVENNVLPFVRRNEMDSSF